MTLIDSKKIYNNYKNNLFKERLFLEFSNIDLLETANFCLNSEPKNLGCFVYPLSGVGGFITFLMLFAAIGFSAYIIKS